LIPAYVVNQKHHPLPHGARSGWSELPVSAGGCLAAPDQWQTTFFGKKADAFGNTP
jgi:hypothetical protein